jgi:predicted acyl esterase
VAYKTLIVDRNVEARMRDGVILRADVYRFPRFDRNPNAGHPIGDDAELRTALQTILHDAAHPSHIVLPIVPRG